MTLKFTNRLFPALLLIIYTALSLAFFSCSIVKKSKKKSTSTVDSTATKAVQGSEKTTFDLSTLLQVRDTGKKQTTSGYQRETFTIAYPEWYFGDADHKPGTLRFYSPNDLPDSLQPVLISYTRETGTSTTTEAAGKDSTVQQQASYTHTRDTAASESTSTHKAQTNQEQDTSKQKLLSGIGIGIGIFLLLSLIAGVVFLIMKANKIQLP